jgi:uncharacterized protein YprB with RNaseH-like and TPR domain
MAKIAPENERIGFLDIETSNLVADFGIILSYCIKPLGHGKKIDEARITKKDIREGREDGRVVEKLLRDLAKYDRVVTYYGCVTPGHKVLTSDFNWVPVESLKAGDTLLGFDEYGDPWRKWKPSTVIHNIEQRREVFQIELENGELLIATGDHPWLVKRGGLWVWRTTQELLHFNSKPVIQRVLPIWQPNWSRDAGYIAGFIDSEGGIYQPQKTGRTDHALQIYGSQNRGKVLDNVITSLDRLGYKYSTRQYDKNHENMVAVSILGSKADKLRFLGEVRPEKLRNVDPSKLERVDQYEEIGIRRIIPAGVQTVCGLGTSSETYVVNGFGSHNTRFDIPYIRTRAMVNGVGHLFPSHGVLAHTDLYYVVRSRFKLSSNRLENANRVLLGKTQKTRVDSKYWRGGVRGDRASLEYILDHNRKDVLDLEKLYLHIKRYMRPMRRSA